MTTINQINTVARAAFIDGIITGKPVGVNVGAVLQRSAEYGKTLAMTEERFNASVNFQTFEDLNRHAVEVIMDGLCGDRRSLTEAINTVVLIGAAFAFHNEKKRAKEAKQTGAAQVIIDKIIADKIVGFIPSDQTIERLFAEINKIEDTELLIKTARLACDNGVTLKRSLPSVKKFIDDHLSFTGPLTS